MDPIMALLQGGDPLEEQKRLAARLRGEEQMKSMVQNASKEGQGMDILNFVAANSGNKALGDSVGLLTKSRQARYAPMKLDKGIMIPGTGDYQESPGVADEREADRDNRRLLALSTFAAKQQATEAAERQRQNETDTKWAIGQMMGQAALDRAAAARDKTKSGDDAKAEKDLLKNVRNFSNDQKKAGLPQLADAISGIHGLLDQPDGKIEGIGYGQETLSKIPILSDMTVGATGKANRSKVQKLLNAVIETEAGKNVTNNEKVRQAIVNMSSDNYSEKDFRNAMDVLLPALENVRANALRGAHPSVVDAYLENDPAGYNPRTSLLHRPKAAAGKPDPVAEALAKYPPPK